MPGPLLVPGTWVGILALLLLTGVPLAAAGQDAPARFIFIGAHPDDADLKVGGTAALLAASGHDVKFLSVTNGEAGHIVQSGGVLARRRRAEADEAALRLGITYEVMDFPDGQLMPDLAARNAIVKAIREWRADVVVGHRPNDYHPDHRYSGMLVQDAAILVQVPNLLTATPALEHNPVFLYFEDEFRKPLAFSPDIAVVVDAVYVQKMKAQDAHVSQFHEFLPAMNDDMGSPPEDEEERLAWLAMHWTYPIGSEVRASAKRWYGDARGSSAQHIEAFEVAEYGHQPTKEEIRSLFSMLGD